MNVAYHLNRLGLRALPVTAVGRDALGEDLLRRLRDLHLETDFISQVPDRPTGTVRVTFDHGAPRYQISREAAWDWIETPPELLELAAGASALVFGSLAQRGEHNRLRLADLRGCCGSTMQVFDVNLRAPFDAAARVAALAQGVDLIKLNHEEIARLLEFSPDPSDLEAAARRLADQTACPRVCVTAGERGAGLLYDGEWFWSEPEPVLIKDTVGAGDAFLAALLHGLLATQRSPGRALERACRLAEFVASQDGATPSYASDGHGGWTAP